MKLSLEDFRITPATHIVSLGKRCSVAYNLRRFYNFRSAFPLDWWITPASGIVKFLRQPDVGYLYDPALLKLTPNAASVRHRELGIQLHHEFPRNKARPGQPIKPGWKNAIENPKSRTIALIGKFLGLNAAGNRIAFVREDAELAAALTDRLDALFPLADYTLIVLPKIPGGKHDAFKWKGDPALWNKALGDLNLSLDRTHHQPFDEKAKIIDEEDFQGTANPARQKNSSNALHY